MKPPRYGHMLADGLPGTDVEGRRFGVYDGPLRGVPGVGDASGGGGGGGGNGGSSGGGAGSSGGVAGAFSYGGGGLLSPVGDDEDQSLASLSYRYTTRKSASNRYPANTAVARFSRRAWIDASLRRARARMAASVKSLVSAARSAQIVASRYSYLAVLAVLAIPFCGGLFLVLAATSGRRSAAAIAREGVDPLSDIPGLPPELRQIHELATGGASGTNGSAPGGVRGLVAAHATSSVPLTPVMGDALRVQRTKIVFKTRSPKVSLLLACKNREAAVEMEASAWSTLEGVGEIILVDWGDSMPALATFPVLAEMASSGKLLRVTAGNSTTPWSLPRAYNLAASLASGLYLLKLDCDTNVLPGFLKQHPVNLHSPAFYTTANDVLSGVLLVSRSRFLHVGGYDERLVGFGGEAVDLRARLTKEGGEQMQLVEDLVVHSRSEELLYMDDAVVVPGLARRRHALGLKYASQPWSSSLAHRMGNKYELDYSAAHSLVRATIKTEAPELFSVLGAEKTAEITATVTSETLHDDFRVPWDVIPQLSVADQAYLVSRFHATKQDARALFVLLGGLAAGERLHCLVSALQLGLERKLPVVVVWVGQEPSDEGARGDNLITLDDILDLKATNEKLAEMGGRLGADGGDGVPAVQLISMREWKCRQRDVHACASLDEGSDPAYGEVAQLPVPLVRTVWDETAPVPLRPGAHTLLRLGGHVRIGNEVSRAAVYGALVPNAAVAAALADRGGGEDKVAVYATTNKVAAERFGGPQFAPEGAGPALNEKEEVRLVVTGPGWVPMKEYLYGAGAIKDMGLKVGARRSVVKAVAEVADALAAAKCKTVWPELSLLADTYGDTGAMALLDTQPLAQNY